MFSPKICLLALIGPPATGKTTFCKEALCKLTSYNIIHVCYDKIIALDFNTVSYKSQRQQILYKINILIDSIVKNQTITKTFENSSKISYNSNNKFLILFDDNNFYRSMRYEIYKVAKNYSICFGQLYFELIPEIAEERNILRKNPVSSDILNKLNDIIESPGLASWEKNSLFLKSVNKFDFKEIENFIEFCYQNPISRVNITSLTIKQENSKIHEIDLVLRKHIGQILLTKNKTVKPTLANLLNKKRKEILINVKFEMLNIDILKKKLDDVVDTL